MFKRVILGCVVISTFVASSPLALVGQATDPKRDKKAAEVKQKIEKLGTGQNAVVKVKLYNDTEYKGYVSRAGDEDFDVVDTSQNSHLVKYSEVRSIGGKNMSTGTKIAIGVGIGAGVTGLVLFLIFRAITENN